MIERCLAKDPHARFATAAELRDALDAVHVRLDRTRRGRGVGARCRGRGVGGRRCCRRTVQLRSSSCRPT